MWSISSNFSLLQFKSSEIGLLIVNMLLCQGSVGLSSWLCLIVSSKSQVLHWLVGQVIVLQNQVFWYFEFLIIFFNVLLTWQNKWMTIPSLCRLLLILEEVRSCNVLSEVVHERSCGFGLGKSQIWFEALTIVVVTVWRWHRCHLATHFVKIDWLSDWMACMTAHHWRIVSWRVRLR